MPAAAARDVVELASQLIAIPSVNPMGRDVSGPQYGERRLTEWLCQWGARLGVPAITQRVTEEQENVVFVVPGDDRRCLLWEVHQDTVPVDSMTIAPFEPAVRDGKLYGRGACDVKGSMACMLTVVAEWIAAADASRPTLVVACAVDEEASGAGAGRLPELWREGRVPTPHAAVVAEPTQLDVVVAHKGVVRWRCHAAGRAAHSSTPQLGDNAIYRMGRVVAALDRLHRDVLAATPPHPLLGAPSISVGRIWGGLSVNTVADRCTIEIDRRVLPGEAPEQVWRQAQQWIADLGEREHITHDPPFLESGGLTDENNQALAASAAQAAQSVGAPGACVGVAYGTDASRLSPHLPCIVFGPGDIDQAHTDDEWIEVDQLRRGVEALRQIAIRGAGNS